MNRRSRKTAVAGVATAAVLGLMALTGLMSSTDLIPSVASAADGSVPTTQVASSDVRDLGDIGPGACWPRDERVGGGTREGFAVENGPELAANWLEDHPQQAARLDRHLSQFASYYRVREVVVGWDELAVGSRAADYVREMTFAVVKSPITVLNTYCEGDHVVKWEVQTFPVDEPLFFVPGHEPGTADVRPAFKAVCGNPLLPVPRPKKPTGTTTTTTKTPPTTTTVPTTTRTATTTSLPPKKSEPQPEGVEKPTRPNSPSAEPRPSHSQPRLTPPPNNGGGSSSSSSSSSTSRTTTPTNENEEDPGGSDACPPGKTTC